jgi:hypothetical protein
VKLPNPDQAVISADKLEGYSLNPAHAEGRHKATVFQAALGLNQTNAEALRSALKQVLKTQDAVPTTRNPYGQKYQIDFEMTHNGKTALIRSIWIIRQDENVPRLVTCYIS